MIVCLSRHCILILLKFVVNFGNSPWIRMLESFVSYCSWSASKILEGGGRVSPCTVRAMCSSPREMGHRSCLKKIIPFSHVKSCPSHTASELSRSALLKGKSLLTNTASATSAEEVRYRDRISDKKNASFRKQILPIQPCPTPASIRRLRVLYIIFQTTKRDQIEMNK